MNNHKALIPVFATTLFLSAFLIFSVQPMVSKMLLPLLGGSPSVWNTAMVFFQAMLLLGYGYAHLMARYFSLLAQAFIHLFLLTLMTCVLPIAIPEGTTPPEQTGQALWQIGVMAAYVGGPFFILAASAPLFQHWFSSTPHKDSQNPYFLYAVSNAGSMLSLLSYPILIEPFLGVNLQTHAWFAGYAGLIAMTAVCAYSIRSFKKPEPALSSMDFAPATPFASKAWWVGLSFVPSSLMLGVTTFITTDLVSAPFLWILPLAIYLATFIIAFARKPILGVYACREITPYILCLLILSFMISSFVVLKGAMIGINLLAFFMCALLCHSELARLKPSAAQLTEYFLLVSLGGVLGGIFNALLAPILFKTPIEYPLVLSAIGFVVYFFTQPESIITKEFNKNDGKKHISGALIMDFLIIGLGILMFFYVLHAQNNFVQVVGSIATFSFLFITIPNRLVFSVCAFAALTMFQPGLWSDDKKLLEVDRNYYGVLRVYSKENTNFFYHGTTIHGAQIQIPDQKFTPVTYYSKGGTASDIFAITNSLKTQKVAALGLGVGSIACYKNYGRTFDFYEIDPDVIRIAEDKRYFSYLSDCGSPYKTIVGDARLKIQDVTDGYYDLFFIDTFSADNIPVHIMTKEAFVLYLQKLAPNGIISMNISNRYFNLRPVLNAIAKDLGLTIYFKIHVPEKDGSLASQLYTTSVFAVMSLNPLSVAPFAEDYGWQIWPSSEKQVKPWTDDYANILGALAEPQ